MVQLDRDARLVGQNVGRGNPSPMFDLVGKGLEWTAESECARRCSDDLPLSQRMDPDLWFCSDFETDSVHEAVSVCEECPVAISCLRYALEHDLEGIWGGTTYRMRKSRGRRNKRKIKRMLGEYVGD